MGEHYYSEKPRVKSEPQTIKSNLRGRSLTFTTDRGVFSKDNVDFGTRLLVEVFEFPDLEGDVLDVGCGYGPIGLTVAASEPARKVSMVDINERAVELARQNAHKNNIENVSIMQSDRLETLKDHHFAAVLTNPPIRAGKDVVHDIFEQSFQVLKPGGELWVVIQKKQGAPSAIKKLEESFETVKIVQKSKGYYILKAVKQER
ncbi:class I SAM-dependent methyltransferase [Pseudalkalibacillus caeni]|uniref:Class I SAM-dependent methyltransferase n=1 Tax=Exobacillus caeni TaxID=2574798 RepID=A0A5R9F226_9BACL|nr:class I SAM-dependent methyltransferase [Pseudalkalibacillus caeni]TLS35528.1 class I SAM-dependent methyltransferase [Pseudalkalibacillus caeni]